MWSRKEKVNKGTTMYEDKQKIAEQGVKEVASLPFPVGSLLV